jgi:cytochrome P450
MSQRATVHFADPKVQVCPYAAYREVSALTPAYKDPDTGHYIITDYALVKKISADVENFSNRCGILLGIEGPNQELAERITKEHGFPMLDVLVSGDPPDHVFHRSLIDKVFALSRVRKLVSYIQDVVDEYIDRFIDLGSVDFHAEMAVMVPMTIIADQLGVPRSDIATFTRWSNAAVDRVDLSLSTAEFTEAVMAHCELQQYLAKKSEEYRQTPADCLLSDLVHAESDGRRLSTDEIVAIGALLIVAGNETTTSAISSAMLQIAEQPDLQAQLRENPNLIPKFTEELLRMNAPLQGLFRRAVVDTVVGGVPIPAGSILNLRYAAANRDPKMFEDPDTFKLDRPNARQHVTFGYGAHFCVGSQLAREEIRVVLETMLRRTRNIALNKEAGEAKLRPSYITYGLGNLPLTFEKVA